MKNQKSQKAVLHLRVYSPYGSQRTVARNNAGAVLNENQIIKLEHDTLEYLNFLKHVKYLGYVEITVEKATRRKKKGGYADIETSLKDYQFEVDKHFLGPDEAALRLKQTTADEKTKTSTTPQTKNDSEGEVAAAAPQVEAAEDEESAVIDYDKMSIVELKKLYYDTAGRPAHGTRNTKAKLIAKIKEKTNE